MLADCVGWILDEIAVARTQLQRALQLAFLSAITHLFAERKKLGRVGSGITMQMLAQSSAIAAVADALKLHVRILDGALRSIALQSAPNLCVMAALIWRQRGLKRRKEPIGDCEQVFCTLIINAG